MDAANGQSSLQIASTLNMNPRAAALWRQRAQNQSIQSVREIAPERKRKPLYEQARCDALIQATLRPNPKG